MCMHIYVYVHYIEEVLEAGPHKAKDVWPATTHHENYTS